MLEDFLPRNLRLLERVRLSSWFRPKCCTCRAGKLFSHPLELPSELPFSEGRVAKRIVSVIEKEIT